MIDGFQSVVIDRILEAVGVKLKHARPLAGCHRIDIIGTDGLCRHLDVLPLIRVVVPLIGHQRHGHELGALTVPVILIIPDDRERNFVQLNGTGDRTAVVVADFTVAIRVNVRRRVAIEIERRGLIGILDGHCIVNGFLFMISLIIFERVRPGIAVIGNVAQCSRDLNFARIGVMHRELAHRHTVGVQNQHHGLGTDTVVVVIVIPVNRELDIIAGGNQRMIEGDERIILARICLTGSIIVIHAIRIERIHAAACISQTGCCQLHRALLPINLRSLNLMDFTTDICIVQENNLICPLLQTGVIICDMLQVNLRSPCVRFGTIFIGRHSNTTDHVIVVIGIYQTKLNLRRTSTVIVLIVVPNNFNIICAGLFFPLGKEIQRPVTLGGHRGIRVIVNILAGVILQKPVEIRRVQILAVSFLACHTAAAMGRIPVGERPANGVFHRPKDKQLVVIKIILGMNHGRTVAGIVVCHDDLLGSPSSIVITSRLDTLFIAFQRLCAVGVQIPAVKSITLTLRLFFQNRNPFATRINLFRVNHPVRVFRLKDTAIGVPVCFFGTPYTEVRIGSARVFRCKRTRCSRRLFCPTCKIPAFARRRVRIRPLDGQLERIRAAIRANGKTTLIRILAALCRQRRKTRPAIVIRVKKYSVQLTTAARRNRVRVILSKCANLPL